MNLHRLSALTSRLAPWRRERDPAWEPAEDGVLPLPPLPLRHLVGPLEQRFFDNPSGSWVFPEAQQESRGFVLDWGCGCGRIARQLIQQRPQPERYLGLDVHRDMVRWCRENLAPWAAQFHFEHHDARNPSLNPRGRAEALPLPVDGEEVSLFIAWSVFTHVLPATASFYLAEMARVLRPGGLGLTTWFLFDKRGFPMMQAEQNALFINLEDPTNAVIFDKAWLREAATTAGLRIESVIPPEIRGYHWKVYFRRSRPSVAYSDFPEDRAPYRNGS